MLVTNEPDPRAVGIISSRLVGLNGSLSPKASPQISSASSRDTYLAHPTTTYTLRSTSTSPADDAPLNSHHGRDCGPGVYCITAFSHLIAPLVCDQLAATLTPAKSRISLLTASRPGSAVAPRIGTDCLPVSIGLLLHLRSKLERAIHSRSSPIRNPHRRSALIRSTTSRTV